MPFAQAVKNAVKNEANKKVFGHAHPVQHGKNKLNPKHQLKQKIIQQIQKILKGF